MRWTPGGTSGDIEDRRDEGGGGGGFGFGGMHIGIGGMIILLVLSFVFKRNFFSLLGSGGGPSSSISTPDRARDAKEQPTVEFVSFVLDDAQKTWADILQDQGIQYRHAKLVLFRDATFSGCGSARAATGPFYCPADEKVYIDLGFYDELRRRFGAPGQFAQAYVLAHEIGHHVQKLMGVEQKVTALMRSDPEERNHCRSSWSFRRIAWPEYGRTPLSSANFWNRVMWRAPSAPRRPWEMTVCRRCPLGGSVQSPLHMAVRPSARNGSIEACHRGPFLRATRSNKGQWSCAGIIFGLPC